MAWSSQSQVEPVAARLSWRWRRSPVTYVGQEPAVQRFREAAAGKTAGVMLAEGVRLVWDAVRAGLEVVEAAVSPKLADIDLRDALAGAQARSSTSPTRCSPAQRSRRRRASPCCCGARVRRARCSGMAKTLVVAAAGLRDPGNVGAVLRSAEAPGDGLPHAPRQRGPVP